MISPPESSDRTAARRTISRVTETAELQDLEPAWRRLAARQAGPFCDHPWSVAWWRALGGGRRLRVLVARDGAEIRGIAPLFEELEHGRRVWRLLGSAGGGADALELLCEDESIREALVRSIVTAPDRPDLLQWDDLRSDAPLIATTGRLGGDAIEVEPRFCCPYISLTGDWEALLRRLPRRETLGRRERWLAALPGLRIERHTQPDEVRPLLELFLSLHEARWRADGGSQAFPDRRLVGFHRALVPVLAAEGALALWSLSVCGRTVAMAWTLEDGRRTLYYQSGMAPEWSTRSPGLVLLARVVRDAVERGQEELDFLRGNEAYKYEWATGERRTVRVLWPLTARGHQLLRERRRRAELRSLITGVVPERLLRPLRRAVRATRLSSSTAPETQTARETDPEQRSEHAP